MYRCAPEQLRHVTQQLSDIHEHVSHGTVFEEIRRAGTKANFKNIATEMEDEPEDSELHEEGPKIPESSNPAQALQVPLVRARFKQSNHVNRELAAGTGVAQENAPPDQGGEQQRSLCRDDGHRQGDEPARTGQPADTGRPLQGPDVPRSPRDRPGVRPLAESASSSQSQVSGREGVCSPQPVERHSPRDQQDQSAKGSAQGRVSEVARKEFWRRADSIRRRGVGRSESRTSRKQQIRDDDHDDHHDGSVPGLLGEDQSAEHHLRELASGHAPQRGHDESAPAEPAGAKHEDGRDGTSSPVQGVLRGEGRRQRSRWRPDPSGIFAAIREDVWNDVSLFG